MNFLWENPLPDNSYFTNSVQKKNKNIYNINKKKLFNNSVQKITLKCVKLGNYYILSNINLRLENAFYFIFIIIVIFIEYNSILYNI